MEYTLSPQILAFIFLILLLGLFSLNAVNTAFRRLQRKETKNQINMNRKLFFYRYFITLSFADQEYEALYFCNLFTQRALQFIYAILCWIAVIDLHFEVQPSGREQHLLAGTLNWPINTLYLGAFFLVLFVFSEYFGRIIGTHYPQKSIKYFSSTVSSFMLLFSPISMILFKIFSFFPRIYADPSHEPQHDAKQELLEMIEEFNLNTELDPHDKKLMESVMEFKYRIAREIMVPRVDIFCLPSDTTIEEAAKLLYEEGYSRIPVYKDTLDNIIGVLMYKDVLAKYMEHEQKKESAILKSPISTLVKNVLYTPETKKISHLLQEFRKKQVHLAIIVDEYGGTEGIVTIEDILEQIVGEIADEYDETEALFLLLPDGSWLIDARMSILDIEEQIGIAVPFDGDYDTIGGYIFHETGMIPKKGYLITQPDFEIEVIRSNDRRVEKLRIKLITSKK